MEDSLYIKAFEIGYQYGNSVGSDLFLIAIVLVCLIIGLKALK